MQDATVKVRSAAPVGMPPDGFDVSQFHEQIISLVPSIVYVFNHVKQANEFSNRSIGTLLGYTPQEIIDMGDEIIARVIHKADQGLVANYFVNMRNLKDGETTSLDYRGMRRDGSIVWMRSYEAVFQRAADGSVLRHIGVASDITEQKIRALRLGETNEILARRTEELQRTNDELEQLAYIATHDLKSPISNLGLLIQMLEENLTSSSEENKKLLGWMKTSCQQANDKLSALVRVAEVRSGPPAPRVKVDFAPAVEAARVTLQKSLAEADAQIESDFSDGPSIFFSQVEMSLILENLIENAAKYRHPDRACLIHLRSQKTDEGIRLTVHDNGRGLMLPRDEDKVFGLFKRAHAEPAGSGVALYTIRKLLERVGGSISVDSKKGEWTEFTLNFPLQEQIG